jgi:hypothetical protein
MEGAFAPRQICCAGPARKAQPKRVQAKPNKTKQNGLGFAWFIRPNRDFSMGYGDSK